MENLILVLKAAVLVVQLTRELRAIMRDTAHRRHKENGPH